MYICPPFSLVNFVVDGICAAMNREDARELKAKYPNAKVTALRKGRSHSNPNAAPSAVRVIPVSQYMKEIQNG